jgi:hypothetical protein
MGIRTANYISERHLMKEITRKQTVIPKHAASIFLHKPSFWLGLLACEALPKIRTQARVWVADDVASDFILPAYSFHPFTNQEAHMQTSCAMRLDSFSPSHLTNCPWGVGTIVITRRCLL